MAATKNIYLSNHSKKIWNTINMTIKKAKNVTDGYLSRKKILRCHPEK